MHRFNLDGTDRDASLFRQADGYGFATDGETVKVTFAESAPGLGQLTVDAVSQTVVYALDGDTIHIHLDGRTYAVRYQDPMQVGTGDDAGQNIARAPMPGVVVAVKVQAGDAVETGTVLVVIESMKLETSIKAPQAGVVEKVHVAPGQSFERDAPLVTLAQGEA